MKKLLHFDLDRLIIYPYKLSTGVINWSYLKDESIKIYHLMIKITIFVKRLTKNMVVIRYKTDNYILTGKKYTMDETIMALDERLSSVL